MENYWWLNSQQIMIMNLKLLILIEIPTWAVSSEPPPLRKLVLGEFFHHLLDSPHSGYCVKVWGRKESKWSTTVPADSNTLTSWHLVITVHHRAHRHTGDTGTVTVNWALEPSVQDVELFWIRNTWTIDNAIKVWRTGNWSWGKR